MERSGWLVKEGGSIKTWKKRFFVLKNGFLSYSKSEKDKPIDSIDLGGISEIRILPDSKKKGHNYLFEIATPGRTYAFSADTEDEQKAWVKALEKERAKLAQEREQQKIGADDFELLNLVGKGSFGKVLQVKKKDTGRIYAMKVLDKKHILEQSEVEHTLAEKNILMRVHHPFLMNLNFSFQTEDKLYFILDFVNGGEMFYHLQKEKRFNETRARFYAAEILLSLEHLHAHGVIYRDLKPENILMTHDGHICLTDFGLSKEGIEKEEDKTNTFCGTPEYLAPEVLKGKGYGKEIDWWSFGSLLYEMLTGLPPFYSTNIQEMYAKIMMDKLKFPSSVSENAKSLLEALLQRDINIRLKDPVKMKQHAFFAPINWEDLYNKKMPPPWIPSLKKGEEDVSQIDPVFISEKPSISPPSDSTVLDTSDQKNFEGFTYVNEQATLT